MAKPNLKPTAGYALIEPVQTDKKTASGIVLPDTHDEKSQKGKVIAIGGPQVTDRQARECGMDAGFGHGTSGHDVASFLMRALRGREREQ